LFEQNATVKAIFCCLLTQKRELTVQIYLLRISLGADTCK